MTAFPVQEMVLYKHGVGFFVRAGAVSGDAVTLAFKQNEINDVLKSLAVFDQAGGQVLGIHYQTPMDTAARLASSSIRLSERHSLRDLLRDLRGRQVRMEISAGESVETVTGRVIGLDSPGAPGGMPRPGYQPAGETVSADTVSVLQATGMVRVLRLEHLRGLIVEDGQAAYDLSYFLDTAQGDSDRRTVHIRLTPGEHDLVAYYVAPSPTWRVSYRLVAEAHDDGLSGRALLQGWGLFDNRLDEDLENVRVTLVAGQPISFIYDLYASVIPERPVVHEQARVAPGPVEYAAAAMRSEDSDLPAFGRSRSRRFEIADADAAPPPMAMAAPMSADDIAASTQVSAEGGEAGEFFEYRVSSPVTIKRGESALVPIIGAEVQYNRELLYNGAKLPDHPVAALRFRNATGLTLERGPVTVVEDGDYRGEAVIPFTRDGGDVYVPFAVELGIKVTERTAERRETVGLSFRDAYLIYEVYDIMTVHYDLENHTSRPQTVTIEAPQADRYELFDTPEPATETATERRWQIEVGAGETVTFARKERARNQSYDNLRKLSHQQLQTFLHNRWLDDATFQQLADMLHNLALVEQAEAQQRQAEKARDGIYAQQEQLRKNLSALKAGGEEAALRSRILSQLESSQDELEAVEAQIKAAAQQAAAAEKQVQAAIAALGKSS